MHFFFAAPLCAVFFALLVRPDPGTRRIGGVLLDEGQQIKKIGIGQGGVAASGVE